MTEIQWDIISGKYVASAVKASQYPKELLPEVAFIGRSNVGKSSLLNSLARQRGLARVSSTPGKTQTINFYDLRQKGVVGEKTFRTKFYAVDLPGYGFARTAQDNREQWSAFISKYMENF
jgi:GTP-binding protein